MVWPGCRAPSPGDPAVQHCSAQQGSFPSWPVVTGLSTTRNPRDKTSGQDRFSPAPQSPPGTSEALSTGVRQSGIDRWPGENTRHLRCLREAGDTQRRAAAAYVSYAENQQQFPSAFQLWKKLFSSCGKLYGRSVFPTGSASEGDR